MNPVWIAAASKVPPVAVLALVDVQHLVFDLTQRDAGRLVGAVSKLSGASRCAAWLHRAKALAARSNGVCSVMFALPIVRQIALETGVRRGSAPLATGQPNALCAQFQCPPKQTNVIGRA